MNSWAKLQLEEANTKNGFLSWPNKALANMGFLKTNLVSNWRGPVEKKEGEKKRKRKRRWRSQDQGQKGMEL